MPSVTLHSTQASALMVRITGMLQVSARKSGIARVRDGAYVPLPQRLYQLRIRFQGLQTARVLDSTVESVASGPDNADCCNLPDVTRTLHGRISWKLYPRSPQEYSRARGLRTRSPLVAPQYLRLYDSTSTKKHCFNCSHEISNTPLYAALLRTKALCTHKYTYIYISTDE